MNPQMDFIRAHLQAARAGQALPPFAEACAAMEWEQCGRVLREAAPGVAWESLGSPDVRMAALMPREAWQMPCLAARAVPLDRNLPVGGRARLPEEGRAFGVIREGRFVAWAAAAPMLGVWYVTVETQREYRGRGYASACIAGLTEELLREGRAPLYLCEEENEASLRAAVKAGYVALGVWRRWARPRDSPVG